MPSIHFLAQLDAFSHQGRRNLEQLTLLLVQIIVQFPFAIYPRICNRQHTEVHIHIILFRIHGWKHTFIHQDQQSMIQSPSTSYILSGDARSHGLQLPPHIVPELSSLVFLDVQSQIPVQIL